MCITCDEGKVIARLLAEQGMSTNGASWWLQDSIRSALRRDPLDALKDAEVLYSVLKERACRQLGITEESVAADVKKIHSFFRKEGR